MSEVTFSLFLFKIQRTTDIGSQTRLMDETTRVGELSRLAR